MLKKYSWFILGLMVLVAAWFLTRKIKSDHQQADQPVYAGPAPEVIPDPAHSEKLAKGSRVFFIDAQSSIRDTLVNRQQQLRVSGDLFFDIREADLPLHIRTRLIALSVSAPSAFRVNAYDADQGQSIEVLSGNIRVAKIYSSPYPEPDTLHDHNLYMINESIDLSEKEELDNEVLVKWWRRFGKSH